MSEWISVNAAWPEAGVTVDLWITGEPLWIGFYDPGRGHCKSGRTCDWFLLDGRWHRQGGLCPDLSPEVRVTHWMARPVPPRKP
jgi:hypothetical protein